jgi:uncharacterized repeat protein (TIGR02543 family)
MALGAIFFALTGFSAQAQITIMPMGDSITVGVDYYTVTDGGYRDPLYHDLVASGISFTFVGVNNSDATPTLTAAGQTYHNGYGGYQINDLLNNLAGVAAPAGGGDGNLGGYWLTGGGGTGRGPVTPNIILLQIGANDIRLGASAATASANLQTLVTTIHSLTPNTIILIAGTCPFANNPGFNTIIQAYDSYIQNTLVPSLSYTRYVDNYSPFLNADGSVNTLLLGTDDIHPTRYGYPIIAQNWANAIRTLEGSNPTLYNLTVANGTGSGSYPAGSVVTVNSNTPTSGNQFANWTPATSALDNPYWPIATYVMPAAATTVTANYLATGSPAIPNGTYNIVGGPPDYQFPWNSGLSMAAAGTSSGSLVQQQTYVGSGNQQWVLTNLGNNVVELSLPGTTNALSVVGASTTAGANLDVENYTGAASQQWTITQLYGCTEIVNVNSGYAVNIAGYSTQSGSQLVQYNAGYVDNQLFAFYPAGTISPPAAPTGLNASTGSAQISLNWTASSGAISYNIYRGTSAGGESTTAIATGVTVASYIDSGLTNGMTYYYKVAAVNAGGASANSNEASAAPLAGGSTQDINLTGYSQTFDDEFNTLSVTTANPKGAANWYAGPANGSTGDFSESNWNINALSVSNGILTNQAYYANPAVNGQNWQSGEMSSIDPSVTGFSQKYGYFEIRCQMPNAGTGSWPSFWLDSTSGVTGGQNEEIDIFEWYGVTNTPGSDQDFVSEASHNWNPDGSQNTTQPYIYAPQTAMPDGQYPWQAYHTYGCQIDPVHITWYIDGVQTNQIATPTSYITSPFFMILDYALGGGWPLSGSPIATEGSSSLLVDWVRVYSLPSSSAPSAPTGLSAVGGNGQVALNWTAATGATSYNVYRGTSTGGESTTPIATNVTAATYTDTGLTNGTAYYYEVKAVNTYGTSGSSNEATGTPNLTTYALTVTSGSGSGSYAAGTAVTVTAAAPASGYQFAGWTGATSALANPSLATTTLTMPAAATTIAATYSTIPTYALTVTSGTGGGSYAAGTVVTVIAAAPASGYQFASWTGATSALANPSLATTTLTMPAAATSITATYSAIPTYALSVTSGTGSGSFTAGTVVTVTANTPASGYVFAGWTGATSALANPSLATTTLTMPAAATSITATYSAIPTYALTVTSGTGGGSYTAGTVVTVTAAAPANGYQFAGWSGASSALANPALATTTLTMPAAATTIAATYSVIGASVVMSVQFPQYYNNSIVSAMNSNNYTGGVVPVQYWNVADTNTGTSPASNANLVTSTGAALGSSILINSTGANTPLGFTYSGYTVNDSTNNTSFPSAIWYQTGGLTDSYIAAGSSFNETGTPETLSVTGLTATHAYNLIVYVTAPWWDNGGSNPASVNAGSTTYYIETSNSLAVWTQATSTTSTTHTTGNYVEFSNLTGTTSQTVTVTGAYVGLAGFQVVDLGVYSATVPTAPTGLVATAGNGQTSLSWTASAGATSYNVYRGTTSGGEGSTPIATNVTAASYTDTGLTNGTAYYYEVKAVNTAGTSGYSNESSATPILATYALTVTSGSGSGTYAAGTAVTVTATAPASGYQFAGWTGATSALADPASATTTLTMPALATSITATYSVIQSTYALTVTSGTGSGNYAAGTVVTVTAAAPASGYQFSAWTGATSALANPTAATTTLTMPAAATSISATYSQVSGTTYTLSVTNGTGGGNYASGTVVSIVAAAPPTGYQFSGWTESYGGTDVIANSAASTTTVTTSAAVATITGNYTPVGGTTYALTVTGGTGSGNYPAGTIVTIAAGNPPNGSQFVRWLGSTSALVLSDADNSTATITMPPVATTVTASYGLTPTTYAVTVTGGAINNDTGSGHYAAGTVLSVTANAPTSGNQFTGWTGTTSVLANSAFSTTTLTVPAAAATVTANYVASTLTYALTVNSGTGGGTYAPGTAVTVTANAPASGYQFAGWTGSTSLLSNAAAPTTTFNMGSAAASITANYTAISSAGTLVLAVGLERIVPGYTGPAIRIQRPSDNTQTDIGFASGSNLLDTTAVSNFLGQSQGWITTLYAQDGSGNNLTTPLPTSTSTMPTISAIDPTTISVKGTSTLTARNVEQIYQNGQGNFRYFVLPPSVAVNKSQMSAFLAYRPDFSGSGGGDPYQSLYEVGNPTTDSVDVMSCASGLQGLTHNSTVTFSNNNVNPRSQATVVGLVTSPGSAPLLYLDGVGHSSGGTVPPSTTCSGGYLLAGTGTGLYYGIPLFAQYNFLGFALYSGTVSSSTATTISNTMLPRTAPAYNIVADGDSITQGTGSIYGYNMLHYVEPLLNHPADITNLAIYGTTSPSAVGHASYPTAATSNLGILYNAGYTKNIYYLAIGTNDIHGGFGTGAQTWAEVMQALQDAKAMGYMTTVATVLHETGETSSQASEVNSFNALARAAVGQPYLDGLIDYAADTRLGNTGIYYPAYSGDGTHPNDAGYQVMSTIAAPVFNSLIGP